MNILFFLTPKEDVAYIYDTYSLRQVLEKMEYHKYSCIPIITERGKYAGTITEGDLLWGLKNRGQLDLKKAEEVPIISREEMIMHRFGWIPTWRIFWRKPCSRILFRLWMTRRILSGLLPEEILCSIFAL